MLKKLRKYIRGTSEWLVYTEEKYGGYISDIERRKVSEYDPRDKNQLKIGGMIGGDRMNPNCHNYAPVYSKFLKKYINKEIILCEIGVLKGTGIAIWSDLFNKGKIIGLDIDLSHFYENENNLRNKGAFKNNNIFLYEFDQFKADSSFFKTILGNKKIHIVIDDGVHFDEAIINAFNSVYPFLSEDFLYVIEDNATAYKKICDKFDNLKVYNFGEITFITSEKNQF